MVHPQEPLVDDMETGVRHDPVNVGNPSGNRIFDRDHRQLCPAAAYRLERILEGRCGHRGHVGKISSARQVRIRSGLTLERDGTRRRGGFGFRTDGHNLATLSQRYCDRGFSMNRTPAMPAPGPDRREYQHRAEQCQRARHRSACRLRGHAAAPAVRGFPAVPAAT